MDKVIPETIILQIYKIVSLLYVNCSYVVTRNKSKINNQFTCESHTYKCTVHNGLSPTTFCSFRPKWLLTCRHFCLFPSLWSLVPGQTHDFARTKNHYFAFFKSFFEHNSRLLAVHFLDPSSSYSHFTISIGHIQLLYFSSFLQFRLHFLDYEINMRLVNVQTFKKVLCRISYGAGSLATSSLAFGLFAAKQGSLCSPRGRLVASLVKVQLNNDLALSFCYDI